MRLRRMMPDRVKGGAARVLLAPGVSAGLCRWAARPGMPGPDAQTWAQIKQAQLARRTRPAHSHLPRQRSRLARESPALLGLPPTPTLKTLGTASWIGAHVTCAAWYWRCAGEGDGHGRERDQRKAKRNDSTLPTCDEPGNR